LQNELKFKDEEIRQLHMIKKDRQALKPVQPLVGNKRFPSSTSFHETLVNSIPPTNLPVAKLSIATNTEPERIKTRIPTLIETENPSIVLGRLLTQTTTNPLRFIFRENGDLDPLIHPFHVTMVMPCVNSMSESFLDIIPQLHLLLQQCSIKDINKSRILYFIHLIIIGGSCFEKFNKKLLEQPGSLC
jgi:hypothetical protein